VFLIPQRDNDGRHLKDEIICLKHDLIKGFGGFTQQEGIEGWWVSADRQLYHDKGQIAFFVVMEEEQIPALERVLLEFKRHTLQKSIYLEINRSVEERFL